MNGSDAGWFLHTGHETERRTETERRQAAVKDQNRKDGNILVLFAAADGEFLLYHLKFW